MSDDDYETYRMLADAVFDKLNPHDQDIAEVAIAIAAVEYAAAYIEAQPCTCAPNAGPPDFDVDPCDRCSALGRARDVRLDP